MNYEIYDPSPLVLTCTDYCYLHFNLDDQETHDDRLSMNTAFTGAQLTSVEQIKNEFAWFSFSLDFPDIISDDRREYISFSTEHLQELGKTITVRGTDGLRLDFTDYEGNLLSGTVQGTMTVLTHTIMESSDDCISDDMVGVCYEDENVYLPFTIEFSLPVAETEVVPTDVD